MSEAVRAQVAACKHPGTYPVLTACGKYVEAERCTGCPATWWAQIPADATDEDYARYKAWLEETEE